MIDDRDLDELAPYSAREWLHALAAFAVLILISLALWVAILGGLLWLWRRLLQV